MTMLAYHNDPAIKAKYIMRVAAHRAADKLTKGIGWENGKGCAIGCTLENYDHAQYPIELGIPEMLARLKGAIFYGLPNDLSQAWPERFLSAIEPGADLSRVGWQFLHWLLIDSGIGNFSHPLVRDAAKKCADVIAPLMLGMPVDVSAARIAERIAGSAARIAESAAASAAWSAESAAASAAWSAAWSAMADKLISLMEQAK